MADNIKIVGSILSTSQVSRYETDDLRLITSLNIKKNFDPFSDYIEYHVYDITSNPLEDNYNYRSYKLPTDEPLNPGTTPDLNTTNQTSTGAQVGSVSNLSTTSSTYPVIEIDPVQDLQNLGYSSGEFKVQYNIFRNKISSYPSAELFIKEISPDRTEIRVGSVVLTDNQIETGSLALIESYTTSSIFDPFLLNFGNNIQELVTNIVLNRVDTGYEILFKLYNTLDDSITEKSSLWVVEEISTPYIFDINLDAILSAPTGSTLRGPNFSNLSRFGLNSTDGPYENQFANDQEGLFKLNNSQSIDININYSGNGSGESGFGSFVTFGSALSRVHNFYTKVQQIENYNNLIAQYPTYNLISGSFSGSFSSSLQSEINTLSSSINSIISNFDGFENYLYFESGSLLSTDQYGITPYPKSGSYKPYVLLPTTSSVAGIWYASSSLKAEDYDSNNVDYFKYSVPGYIVDDPDNANYVTFLNMMGQFFDNIWVYIKTIPEINLANNNLEIGISKDLVYNMLQSLGVSVFNSFGNQSVANYLLGANTGSASYSGYLTDFSATGSYINNISKKDILAESYKRIYHNLPLLLQRKGTVAGLRTLLSTFGILNQDYYTISGSTYYTPTGSALTSSILNVKEYGGSTTEGLLAGYNNDKVRIIDNITASVSGTFGGVLSPYTSILQYTTASSNFRTADEHYVDISFSPQTQLDTYVSKSISSVNTNWSIDNYIGNPQQLYSGSYSDLDNQRQIYFVNGTGSYAGFTGSLLDYNGFIRLIQFFDNSIFKMLEDSVPARTSLSTGVTINSPVLERNKWSYGRPNNTTNEAEKDGSIVAPVFGSVYDNWYSYLSDSRTSYLNGEIPGTEIDIYRSYFESNVNPWIRGLQYTSSNAFSPQVSSSNPFPIYGYKTQYFSDLTNTFRSDVTASFVSTPSSLTLNAPQLVPFVPSGSFNVNGVIIAITGSTRPANTPSIIYVSTGSSFDNTVNNISASFNFSKSLAPYSSSIQYINANNEFSNLIFTSSLAISSAVANTYYVISGSTTLNFSGAVDNPSSQSFDVNGILFIATSSIFPNTSDKIYVPTGSTVNGTLSNITVALNFSRSLAPYSSSFQQISSSVSASGIFFTINPYGVYPGSSLPKMPSYDDFIRSDYNILLNNVSRSLFSTSRQKLEISGSSGIIGSGSYPLLLSASLQDSYLSLDSYTLPRHKGVKISSLKYNIYTSSSLEYIGDNSYGKTAVIDHYVRKIGLFTQIISSSFFPLRNQTSLKYLIDESGSLTELSQTPLNGIGSNWAEVQNTFKLGRQATVALFDNQQYGDQKTTDGIKSIFDSGYSYYPILYYSGSTDPRLYFQYVGKGNGILMAANNGGFFITGSTDNRYTASAFIGGTGSIFSAFDTLDSNFSIGNSYYSNIRRGQTNSFPTYSISQNTNMAFSTNFGINVQFPTAASSVTYKFDLFYNPTGTTTSSSIGTQTQVFTSSVASLSGILNFTVTSSFRDFTPGDQITFQLRQYGASANLTSSLLSTGDGTVYTGIRNTLGFSGISPNATTGSGQFISGSNGVDTLVFNQSLSSFIDYQYLPATSSVSLHNDYGNVDNTFSPKVGDVIFLYYNNNTQYQELNISRVNPGTKYSINVTPNLVTNLSAGTYAANTVSKVLLLSKVPDETNVNLSFDKDDDVTSYGFLIPDNLSPDLLRNIDTITRQVKQKLLSTNSGITINTV
jgi:hypothetical protein